MMKFLGEIYSNKENKPSIALTEFTKIRKKVVGLILDNQNNICLIHYKKDNVYSFPGGGVEENEDLIEALHREVLEETGHKISDIKEIGLLFEYFEEFNLMQISFVYSGLSEGHYKKKELYIAEEEAGLTHDFVTLEDAKNKFENAQIINSRNYISQRRGLKLLQHIDKKKA